MNHVQRKNVVGGENGLSGEDEGDVAEMYEDPKVLQKNRVMEKKNTPTLCDGPASREIENVAGFSCSTQLILPELGNEPLDNIVVQKVEKIIQKNKMQCNGTINGLSELGDQRTISNSFIEVQKDKEVNNWQEDMNLSKEKLLLSFPPVAQNYKKGEVGCPYVAHTSDDQSLSVPMCVSNTSMDEIVEAQSIKDNSVMLNKCSASMFFKSQPHVELVVSDKHFAGRQGRPKKKVIISRKLPTPLVKKLPLVASRNPKKKNKSKEPKEKLAK
ncbi:unnamed protein product [Lupinus luteus]|uniref:Uncharacterized protein n=1 Tax=Lupinus luteus TaxID=3873 RepID=A0AAV1WP42_LUPLU